MIRPPSQYVGAFWLPAFPSEQLHGSLVVSDDGNLTLSGAGLLPHLVDRGFVVLLGEDESGRRLSLHDCQFLKTPDPNSTSVGPFVAGVGRAFVGAHFATINDVRFKSLVLELPGFLRWFAPNLVLDPDESTGDSVTVSLRGDRPTALKLESGDAYVSLLTRGPFVASYRWGDDQEITVRYQGCLSIEFAEERPEASFWEIAFRLQSFFAFWWGGVVDFADHGGRGEAGRRRIGSEHEVEDSIRIIDRRARPLEQADTGKYVIGWFASFAEVQGQFALIWQRWQALAVDHKEVLQLYLAVVFGEGRQYDIFQFLALAQALEIFHRSKLGGRYLGRSEFKTVLASLKSVLEGHEDAEFLKAASSKLSFLNDLSLRTRIRALLDKHWSILAARVGGETFVSELVDTSGSLT